MALDIFVIIFGLIIGSFLTVCIYRIPYGREKGPGDFGMTEDEIESQESEETETGATIQSCDDDDYMTICYPRRSICPHCRTQLKWYHNIPLLSWIFLLGRCAYCKTRIPFRYPLVELLSALTAWLCFHFLYLQGTNPQTAIIVYAFLCALLVVAFIDIDYYIIPNVISIPCIWIFSGLALLNEGVSYIMDKPLFNFPMVGVKGAFLGFMAGAGLLYAVAKLFMIIRKKEGLGFGDIKLLAMVGILLGPAAALYTIFVGSVLGAVIGILQKIVSRKRLGTPLPFGPYLVAATYLFLFSDPTLPLKWSNALAELIVNR